MSKSFLDKVNEKATQALREAKESLRCNHPMSVRSIDLDSGRQFCGDCGDFTDGGAQLR